MIQLLGYEITGLGVFGFLLCVAGFATRKHHRVNEFLWRVTWATLSAQAAFTVTMVYLQRVTR